MLASLLIVFREVFEAGLIVGIVLAATQGIARRGAWIAGGIGAGVLASMLLATFVGELSNAFAGSGQEVFNAAVLMIAVLMLAWHCLWMASHGREIAQKAKIIGSEVALGQNSLLALAVVVTVAVMREGMEIVLFLYAIATSTNEGPLAMFTGGMVGIGLGVVVSLLVYRGLVAIPVKRLFSVTNGLIALLAAGMAGQAAAILASADIIPSWGYELWDTSWLLPDGSLPGRALRALVGYSDRPMGIQVAAQLAVLAGLLISMRLVNGGRKPIGRMAPQRATEPRVS